MKYRIRQDMDRTKIIEWLEKFKLNSTWLDMVKDMEFELVNVGLDEGVRLHPDGTEFEANFESIPCATFSRVSGRQWPRSPGQRINSIILPDIVMEEVVEESNDGGY